MLLVALKKSENCEHSYAAANATLDLNLKPSDDWEFRDHKCRFTDCIFCQSTVAYIAGFLVYSLKDLIHCEECLHDRPQRRLQPGQAGGRGRDGDRQRVLAAGQPGTWQQHSWQNYPNQNCPRFEDTFGHHH